MSMNQEDMKKEAMGWHVSIIKLYLHLQDQGFASDRSLPHTLSYLPF